MIEANRVRENTISGVKVIKTGVMVFSPALPWPSCVTSHTSCVAKPKVAKASRAMENTISGLNVIKLV